jgi:hypothetical protein
MSTIYPMPPENPPLSTQSSTLWEQLKFLWSILNIFLGLAIMYFTHNAIQRIQIRRTPQQQPTQYLPSTDFERNFGDAIPLQPLRRVFLRQQPSNEDLPAPLYGSHVNDEGLPPGVKPERRGSYQYVAQGNVPPPYTIPEEHIPSRR